jgi:hypothetical protein
MDKLESRESVVAVQQTEEREWEDLLEDESTLRRLGKSDMCCSIFRPFQLQMTPLRLLSG